MNKEVCQSAYLDLVLPDSRLNRAYRRILGWQRMGQEWSPTGMAQLYRDDIIYLEDFECKLIALEVTLTWRQIRSAFPKLEECANAMPV